MRIPAGVLPIMALPMSAVMVQNGSNEGIRVNSWSVRRNATGRPLPGSSRPLQEIDDLGIAGW
jgi:hypothetical protein